MLVHIHRRTGVLYPLEPNVLCEKESNPQIPIIEMEFEELKRTMSKEEFANLEKHLKLTDKM